MSLVIFLATLGLTLATGVPVAFALIICAVAMGISLDMFDPQIITQRLIAGANHFSLLAIPFFLLAGELMNAGGMSKRINGFAMSFVGTCAAASGMWQSLRRSFLRHCRGLRRPILPR